MGSPHDDLSRIDELKIKLEMERRVGAWLNRKLNLPGPREPVEPQPERRNLKSWQHGAVRNSSCSACGAKPGEHCRERGVTLDVFNTHGVRIVVFRQEVTGAQSVK